jgi:hypothetical protein
MKSIIRIVPQKIKKDNQTKHTYMTPAQYHFKNYYTQCQNYRLFHAMRNSIRKQIAVSTLGGNCELWEVAGKDAYVFITDQSYALRAQEILIKWISKKNKNFKYTAYHLCRDLEEKKWRLKSGYEK